jgi:hypothetical protein
MAELKRGALGPWSNSVQWSAPGSTAGCLKRLATLPGALSSLITALPNPIAFEAACASVRGLRGYCLAAFLGSPLAGTS